MSILKELESNIERQVVRWAEHKGIPHLKLNVMFRRAWPDRIFWIKGGRPVLIEFKALGKKPTPLQYYTLKMLENLEYDVCWVDSAEEAISYLAAKIKAAQKEIF